MPVTAPARKARLERLGEAAAGGLGGADVGAHRDEHAGVAGGAGEHRADQEADGDRQAEQAGDDEEDHRAGDGDRGVLPAQVGAGAFLDRAGDLLHPGIAGVGAITDRIAQAP